MILVSSAEGVVAGRSGRKENITMTSDITGVNNIRHVPIVVEDNKDHQGRRRINISTARTNLTSPNNIHNESKDTF